MDGSRKPHAQTRGTRENGMMAKMQDLKPAAKTSEAANRREAMVVSMVVRMRGDLTEGRIPIRRAAEAEALTDASVPRRARVAEARNGAMRHLPDVKLISDPGQAERSHPGSQKGDSSPVAGNVSHPSGLSMIRAGKHQEGVTKGTQTPSKQVGALFLVAGKTRPPRMLKLTIKVMAGTGPVTGSRAQ